jgi:hypothetical protein
VTNITNGITLADRRNTGGVERYPLTLEFLISDQNHEDPTGYFRLKKEWSITARNDVDGNYNVGKVGIYGHGWAGQYDSGTTADQLEWESNMTLDAVFDGTFYNGFVRKFTIWEKDDNPIISSTKVYPFQITDVDFDHTYTAVFMRQLNVYISGPTTPPCSYTDWTAIASGGYPPYHYQWYDKQGSFSPQLKNKITPDAPIGQWIPVGTDSLILNFFICTGRHTLRVDITDDKGYTATAQLVIEEGGFSPAENNLAKDESIESIKENAPQIYELGQNYPNPFNPTTKIRYAVKQDGFVTIKVYDLLGKVVATLVNENKPAGFYDVNFDASKLSSGIYFYTIRSNDFFDRKKMIILK